MTDLIEKIGPFLGIAAFLGLAILAFLIFQQAREVRRLREWAGRAPERADEAAEASLAAAEARGEVLEEEATAARGGPDGRFAALRRRSAAAYVSLDRSMPFDPRYLFALLAAVVIAVAVLTSGFGLVGGGDSGNGDGKRAGQNKERKEQKIEVAVLNATQSELQTTGEPLEAVEGLASKVSTAVVKPAGFKVGVEGNAPDGEEETVVMFDPEAADPEAVEEQATKLAKRASEQLGEIDVVPMVGSVRAAAKNAPIALVIGADNAEF